MKLELDHPGPLLYDVVHAYYDLLALIFREVFREQLACLVQLLVGIVPYEVNLGFYPCDLCRGPFHDRDHSVPNV